MAWIEKFIVTATLCQVVLSVNLDYTNDPAEARESLSRLIGQTNSIKRDYLDAAFSTENKQIGFRLATANSTASLALSQRLEETSKLISDLSQNAKHFSKLDVSQCVEDVPTELETYRRNAQSSISRCYSNLLSKLSSMNSEIYTQGNKHVYNELSCTQKSLKDCDSISGQNDCYQKFSQKVEDIQENLRTAIMLYTSTIMTAAEGLAVPCEDAALGELSSSVAVLMDRVTACIRFKTISAIGDICT